MSDKYEIIEYNGQEARRYFSDGSIRDAKGHLLKKHPRGYTITRENAGELSNRRWQLHNEHFAHGLAQGLHLDADKGTAATWQHVGRRTGELLNSATHGSDFVRLAEFAGKQAGIIGTDNNAHDAQASELQGLLADLVRKVIGRIPA